MNYALINNGAITGFVQTDVAFTHLGKQYSARFLRTSTKDEKVAAGVFEVVDGARADERFYWVGNPTYRVVEANGTVESTFSSTPKLLEDREEVDEQGNPMYVQVLDNTDPANPVMVDSEERLVTKGLKSQWISQVKQTAGSMLAATDWMVIRKAERDVAIPAEVQTYRAAVVAECDRLETAIAACASVEALIGVVAAQNWPKA
jgi:hypothetical protein